MNLEWASLRVLHVVCGTIWVGGDFFLTAVLFPRLRALGTEVERPVLGELARYLPPVMMTCSIVTVVTGVWMAGSMQGWTTAWMFASGWGTAIAIGLIGTLCALAVGLGLLPPLTIRYDKMMRAIAGRKPTPEEARDLEALAGKVTMLARLNTALLLIVVASMAVARVV